MKKDCKKCKKSRPIVNKFFELCQECNKSRLDERKGVETCTNTILQRKSLRQPKNSVKRDHKRSLYTSIFKTELKKPSLKEIDEEFYLKCFNLSDHKCEECGADLPEFFKQDGKIAARFRYSHIIPKSIAPELRHTVKNINHLCLACHSKWEFGDKKSMQIYVKNKAISPNQFS